jgi:hypothetical protein
MKNRIKLSTSDLHLFESECLAEQKKRQYEPWTGKDEPFFATGSDSNNK